MGVVLERFTTPHRPSAYLRALLPRLSARLLGGPVPARVVSVTATGIDAAVVALRVPRRFGKHRPGQFLAVTADINGTRHTRSFTITSHPSDPQVELTVQAHRDGVVSRWFVEHARPGDLVHLSEPAGEFCLDGAGDRLLMISGGSGITPMLAMLRHMATGCSAAARTPDVVLVHHATSTDAVLHGAELRALDASMAWLTTHLVLTRAPDGARVPGAHLDEQRLDQLCADWRDRTTFSCGPHGLIEFVRACWSGAGVADRLRIESFGTPRFDSAGADPDTEHPAGEEPGAEHSHTEHTANFSRSEVVVPASGESTLLAAAESAGLKPPHGCRMGICHGCATPLRQGRARDLRDGTLLEAGCHVQICVAAAASDVVIEL